MSISVDSSFESGSIELVNISPKGNIDVNICKDSNADVRQWFYFSIGGIEHQEIQVSFLNAAQCSYPKGWEGYKVCASFDRITWFRLPTEFDGNVMKVTVNSVHTKIYLAYFPPYNMQIQDKLLQKVDESYWGRVCAVGKSENGNSIPVIQIGYNHPGKKVVWVIAGQHPGETMGNHVAKGLIESLSGHPGLMTEVLKHKCVFYVVPNINPDGTILGNLRTNAHGVNLNREWDKDESECAKEVAFVKSLINETGVDLFLDLHGDEVLPYVFSAGSEGIHNSTQKMLSLYDEFCSTLLDFSSDYQMEYGYPKKSPGTAVLGVAKNYIASKFQCLAMTIEMPFKDAANNRCDRYGWSVSRCKIFAKELLLTIQAVAGRL